MSSLTLRALPAGLLAVPRAALPVLPAALALGLAAGLLPLPAAAALLLGAIVLLLVALEPALGLGLMLLAAPLRAWLNVWQPGLGLDPGQALFALTLAAWLARGAAARRIVVPRLPMGLGLGLGAVLLVGGLSLWSAPALGDGLAELAKWAQVGLAALLAKDAADRGRLGWVLAALLASGALQAAVGLWQFGFSAAGPDSFRVLGSRFRAYGTFEQPNPFAGYMGLVWPLAAGWAAHLLGPSIAAMRRSAWQLAGLAAVAGLCAGALVLSFSRGAWLGAGATALALAVFLPRRYWLGLPLAAAAALALVSAAGAGLLPAAVGERLAGLGEFTSVYDVRGAPINDENYAVIQRLAFWQTAQAMAAARPWLGVGLGNFAAAYPAYALLNWPLAIGHAHNVYLNTLAETGVLGLAAYLALWVAALRLTFAALRRSIGWQRGVALGLLGAWVHLAVHHMVDYLYVNNIHLALGVMFGALACLAARPGAPSEAAL